MKVPAVVVAALHLTACLSYDQMAERSAAQQRLRVRANVPVICQSREECEVAWGRAVAWVSSTCGWKVKNQTDYLIETEGPIKGEAQVACRVNRVPLDATRARFELVASCGEAWVCDDRILAAEADFADTINAFIKSIRAE